MSVGVDFLSTMQLIEPIVELCAARSFPLLCGVRTAAEARRAVSLGADIIKLFPVSEMSTEEFNSIRHAIRAINPDALLVASGGVNASNLAYYIGKHGCHNAAIGLDLSKVALSTCLHTVHAVRLAITQQRQKQHKLAE